MAFPPAWPAWRGAAGLTHPQPAPPTQTQQEIDPMTNRIEINLIGDLLMVEMPDVSGQTASFCCDRATTTELILRLIAALRALPPEPGDPGSATAHPHPPHGHMTPGAAAILPEPPPPPHARSDGEAEAIPFVIGDMDGNTVSFRLDRNSTTALMMTILQTLRQSGSRHRRTSPRTLFCARPHFHTSTDAAGQTVLTLVTDVTGAMDFQFDDPTLERLVGELLTILETPIERRRAARQ